MGTKMGPSYANLFVEFIEKLIFEQYSGPKPEFFGRYIDDCFGATSCSKPDLKSFILMLILFIHHLILLWKSVKLPSLFLTSRLVSLTIILAPVFITSLPILTRFYCIHPHIPSIPSILFPTTLYHSTAMFWYHIKHQLLLKTNRSFLGSKKSYHSHRKALQKHHIFLALAAHISKTVILNLYFLKCNQHARMKLSAKL